MSLTRGISTQVFENFGQPLSLPVASGAVIYRGSIVCLNANGYAVPGQLLGSSPLNSLSTVGIARADVDNTNGSDGTLSVPVIVGVARLQNDSGDPIAQSGATKIAYVKNEYTVSATDGGATQAIAGLVVRVDSDAVWISLGALGSVLTAGPITSLQAGALQKRQQRIQYTDLTDAVNGEAQAKNVGAALPANAVVLGHEVQLTTQFTGGGATSCKLNLGGTDTVAICNQFDVFGSTAAGKRYSPGYEHGTLHGDHCTGLFSSEQLVATFTPDASHALSGLTAGDMTVTVWFMVLA